MAEWTMRSSAGIAGTLMAIGLMAPGQPSWAGQCWTHQADPDEPESTETWCFDHGLLRSNTGVAWRINENGIWTTSSGRVLSTRIVRERAGWPDRSDRPRIPQRKRLSIVQMSAVPAAPVSEVVSVPQDLRPWQGHWWPYSEGALHRGPSAPLALWDQMMTARQRSSQAQAWEATSRAPHQSVSWAGHCNGWAAASQLYSEPNGPLKDPVSGIVLSVSQQKGLLTSSSFCVRSAFFGRRYRGSQDDINDINPALFHEVVVEYIKNQQRPLSIDIDRDEAVNNKVAVGYRMDVSPGSSPDWLRVVMNLEMASYSGSASDDIGPASTISRTYEYELKWNSETAEVVDSRWLSANPDFLWAPLENVDCGRENPHVRASWIREFFSQRRGLQASE